MIGLASTMSERRLTLARNGEISLMLLMERSKCRSSVHLSKLGHIAVTIIAQFTSVRYLSGCLSLVLGDAGEPRAVQGLLQHEVSNSVALLDIECAQTHTYQAAQVHKSLEHQWNHIYTITITSQPSVREL